MRCWLTGSLPAPFYGTNTTADELNAQIKIAADKYNISQVDLQGVLNVESGGAANEYLGKEDFSDEEGDQFKARHLYRTQIGANAYFLGNGATEFTLHEKNRAAIEGDGISIKGKPGKLGVPEMLTIEKDPPSIAMLEKQGSLKSIPLKRGSV